MDSFWALYADIQRWGGFHLFRIGTVDVTLARLFGLFFIVGFSWWFSLFLEKAIHRVAQRGGDTRLSDSGVYAFSRILRYLVWIIGTVLGLTYLGFDLQSLAIIGGAVGVGIGFGLQTIFSNLVSGIIILVEKTLKVGDFVDLQSGVVGTVAEISMRYTRVTTNDLVDVIVPNSEFVNGRVTNWTLDEAFRRIHIPFGVAYGSDKEIVREAAIAAALSVDGTVILGDRQPQVWLVNFGASSLDFKLVVWVNRALMTSPGSSHARYMWALHTELLKRNIEIPFPQQDMHIRSGELRVNLLQPEKPLPPDR